MSCDEEIEWSVVDIISDWSTESCGCLTAEDDIETCFLTRWDDLRERATLCKLLILINKETNIDVLSEIVGHDETLGRRGFDENSLKIDLLRTSVDLLELFSSELNTAISNFGLRLRLSLPLSFDDSVLVGISSLSQTG